MAEGVPPGVASALAETIAGSAEMALVVVDQQLRLRWASPGSLAAGWIAGRDAVGASLEDLFGGPLPSVAIALLEAARRRIVQTAMPDGQGRQRQLLAFPVRFEDETCVGIFSPRMDVHARRELGALAHLTMLAEDVAELGIWEWDLDSGNTRWNEWHERLLGYEPGRPERTYAEWAARVHPDDLAMVEASIQQAVATGEVFSSQYRVLLPSGETRTLHGRGQLVPDHPRRMAGVVMDVTPGLRAEQRERELRTALAAAGDAERKRLAAELHDGAIQLMQAAALSLSATGSVTTDGDAALDGLDDALDLVRRAGDALRLLLGPATGGPLPSLVTLPGELERLGREVSSRSGATIEVRVDVPDDGSGSEVVDVLVKVVGEALTNAGKHAAASRIAVHVTTDGDRLLAIVRDDGDGFEPSSPVGEGHVGLTLLRERVASVGGTVDVSSAPGAGTTVAVSLPDPRTLR